MTCEWPRARPAPLCWMTGVCRTGSLWPGTGHPGPASRPSRESSAHRCDQLATEEGRSPQPIGSPARSQYTATEASARDASASIYPTAIARQVRWRPYQCPAAPRGVFYPGGMSSLASLSWRGGVERWMCLTMHDACNRYTSPPRHDARNRYTNFFTRACAGCRRPLGPMGIDARSLFQCASQTQVHYDGSLPGLVQCFLLACGPYVSRNGEFAKSELEASFVNISVAHVPSRGHACGQRSVA